MTISTAKYEAIKLQMRAQLSGDAYANTPNVTEADLYKFFNALVGYSSGAGALPAAQATRLSIRCRQIFGGSPVTPALQDSEWTDFLTQLVADSASAAAPSALEYAATELALRAVLSGLSVAPQNLSRADLFGYFSPYGASPSTIRQVATRSIIPSQSFGTSSPWESRVVMQVHCGAGKSVSALSVATYNGYVDTAGEHGSGGTLGIRQSIEYPIGDANRQQSQFSGSSATFSIPDGVLKYSDMQTLTTPIPDGAWIAVNRYLTPASAICYVGSEVQSTVLGDATNLNGVDHTGPGTGTVPSTTGSTIPVVAVIGLSNNRAILDVGDSRSLGLNDSGDSGTTGDIGEIGRPFGATNAYICLGIPSDQAAAFASGGASTAVRRSLAQYCTDVIVQYGINDLYFGGGNAASLEASMTTIAGFSEFASKKKYRTTLPPITASTDSWATTANQTPDASNAGRITYNTGVRVGGGVWDGFFDYAAAVESGLNSGKWKVDGTANKYTTDGVHESPFANKSYVFTLP